MFSGLPSVTWPLFLGRDISADSFTAVSAANKIQLTSTVLEWRQKQKEQSDILGNVFNRYLAES